MWWLLHNNNGFAGPRICFEAEGGGGGGKTAEQIAAEEKARKEAEEKAEKDRLKNLTDKEAELLKEVMDKKKKIETVTGQLTETQTKLQQMQEQLKTFEGIDPAEVRKILAERKTAEEKELLKNGEFDRLKQRMVEEHTKELKAISDKVTEKDKSLADALATINDLTVGTAFHGSNFIKDELVLTPGKARVIYGPHFDIENGQVVAFDKPKGSGERTKLVSSRGEPLPFDDAMKKLVDMDADRDRIVRSKLASGANSNTNAGGKGGANNVEPVGRERIAAGLLARKKA